MWVTKGVCLALAVAIMACGGGESAAPTNDGGTTGSTGSTGSTGATGGTGGTGTTPTATNQVSVMDGSFNPASIAVAPGTTVTWTWTVAITHNVTFDNSSLGGSGNLSTGTYTKNFPTAGTFGYQCTLHAGMTGSVTVQ